MPEPRLRSFVQANSLHSLAASDELCDQDIEHDPQQHITGYDPSRAEIGRKREVEENKQHVGRKYGYQGFPLSESESEELVMYMTFVGQKRIMTVAYAMQENAGHIEAWHNDRRYGYDKRVAFIQVSIFWKIEDTD